jgi:hypothetical protein
MIKPESIRIWLDPDDDTEKWLGWKQTDEGDPLRYVFPDKWGLGAWTPEGLRKQGLYIYSPSENSEWWTFLYPDPRMLELPTTHLGRFGQPTIAGESLNRRVLGLFGPLNYYMEMYGGSTDPYMCLVDAGFISGSKGSCEAMPIGSLPDQVRMIMINFSHIPLDLPGHWQIGITTTQYPAMYANRTRVETKINGVDEYSTELKFGPDNAGYSYPNRYLIETYHFESYIVISTPCLAADPKSCVN